MDCTVLDRSLADFSSLTIQERDNLLTILGLYGMYTLPTAHNICQLVQSIARQQQLLDKPMPFVELIKLGIPDVHRDAFWSLLTVPAIDHLFQQQQPTTQKVQAVIVPEEEHLRQDQLNTLHFLQHLAAVCFSTGPRWSLCISAVCNGQFSHAPANFCYVQHPCRWDVPTDCSHTC